MKKLNDQQRSLYVLLIVLGILLILPLLFIEVGSFSFIDHLLLLIPIISLATILLTGAYGLKNNKKFTSLPKNLRYSVIFILSVVIPILLMGLFFLYSISNMSHSLGY